jgi:7-cyano-7-deazaguanine synthase
MSRADAVVCLSGGLDSCVSLAEARQHGSVAALHLSYGQRTAERERRAFVAICDHYGIEQRLLAEQAALGRIGASALTDATLEVPTELSQSAIPVTYVPFRNAQILALGVAWAEALGAHAVYLGAVEEDGSGYPDCREEFFAAFQLAVERGTRPQAQIRIETPLLHLSKGDIVRRGVALAAPLELTWSCYQCEDLACGVCESCRLRRRGFAAVGIDDPIPYRDR